MLKASMQRFAWLEIVKAVGLAWIFANHTAEQLFGYPFIANPSLSWPPLAERISQLRPLDGFGLWNIPVNALRYTGWVGDQGVQLFIIASGFGLTWGLMRRQAGKPLNIGGFYVRRAERIFPLWWGAHIMFIGIWFLTGWGLSLYEPATILSMLGIRFTPGLLYYFSPAWWYIGLVIQLYLVYPLLWEGLRRWGPTKLLLWTSLAAFAIRAAGLYVFDGYLDPWARGAIFITRLPEFVFGISLAAWMLLHPVVTQKRLHSPWTWILAAAVYALGTLLSLTLPGMIIAPFCLGVGAFVLLYLLLDKLIPITPRLLLSPGVWVGQHSYSLFLVHHPVILMLVPFGVALSLQAAGRILLAVILTVVLALMLEGSVGFVTQMIRQLVKGVGMGRTVALLGLLGVVVVVLFAGADLLVRRLDPQEALGWGERPSLQPDADFGWRLRPSQTTRLRWESYDYSVTANSLGFPGPEYPTAKNPNTFRIMVTGDAFSSAEGVDTDQAWPRLLESELTTQLDGKKVEVLNFAITGYGPNQYEAVVEHFAPIYKPDLVLIQVFVNDFQDVLISNQRFQESIGFDQPAQNGLYATSRLVQLRRWMQLNLQEPLKEILLRMPRSQGYFLGNFSALERGHAEQEAEGKEILAQRLGRIQSIAEQEGAEVIVFMVPAPVQICDQSQLAYYPRGVDLADGDRFDMDLPQRMMAELTGELGLPFYDLRNPLGGVAEMCPYQPRNMHWTAHGHQMVADYLADILLERGSTP